MTIARLRPLEMHDLDSIMQWVNDSAVIGNFANFKVPISRDDEQKFLEKILASETDLVFAIETEQREYVGNASLHQINWPSRVGRIAVIIGKKDHWNEGYAEAAVKSLLELAFDQYNFHKVWGMVWEDNPKTKHLYLDKCGFTQEGILRDEYFHQGKYHTMVRFSMLEGEYRVRRTEA